MTALPLSRVARVTLGKMIPTAGEAEAELPYLRAAHVQPGQRLVLDDVKTMPFTREEARRLELRAGDIAVVEGGAGFGRTAFLEEDLSGWGFQNSINRVRLTAHGDPKYLHYALQSALQPDWLRTIVNTATIPHLTSEKLAQVGIQWIAAEEQRAIVEYLDRETGRIDALIAKQKRLLEVLELRLARAIDEEFGRASEQSLPVKYALRAGPPTSGLMKGQAYLEPEEGTSPAFSASGQDIWLYDKHCHGVKPGLILSAVGARCGKVFMAKQSRWGTVANTNSWYPAPGWSVDFLHQFLNREDFWVKGGAAQPYVQVAPSLAKPVPKLDRNQQESLARVLDRMSGEAERTGAAIRTAITLLGERRQALITAALSGQIEIPAP